MALVETTHRCLWVYDQWVVLCYHSLAVCLCTTINCGSSGSTGVQNCTVRIVKSYSHVSLILTGTRSAYFRRIFIASSLRCSEWHTHTHTNLLFLVHENITDDNNKHLHWFTDKAKATYTPKVFSSLNWKYIFYTNTKFLNNKHSPYH